MILIWFGKVTWLWSSVLICIGLESIQLDFDLMARSDEILKLLDFDQVFNLILKGWFLFIIYLIN